MWEVLQSIQISQGKWKDLTLVVFALLCIEMNKKTVSGQKGVHI